MIILKGVRAVLVFIMSYISFFQFLFGFTTIDSILKVTLIEGFSNSAVICAGVMILWAGCNFWIANIEKKEQVIAGAAFHKIHHQFRDSVFEFDYSAPWIPSIRTMIPFVHCNDSDSYK